jgi:hypothetical protein
MGWLRSDGNRMTDEDRDSRFAKSAGWRSIVTPLPKRTRGEPISESFCWSFRGDLEPSTAPDLLHDEEHLVSSARARLLFDAEAIAACLVPLLARRWSAICDK